MEKVFGTSGKLAEMSVSGMTDLQIVVEALQDESHKIEEIYAKVEDFHIALVAEMERIGKNGGHQFQVLEGVREILTATRENPQFLNLLLTGNLPNAAKFKLDFVGLSDFFDFSLSSFGDQSHKRKDLPAVAAAKVCEKFNFDFAPNSFIVIGDTPNDIACARFFGAKVVSVATGRNHSPELLKRHEPDFLFENLADTQKVFQVLKTV